MTVSTHTYTATLLGSPNRALPIKAGSISLDVSRFPHVEASLLVPVPDTSLLQYLDPRQKLRVRIVATATFPTFSQNRTFNLGLRRVRPNRATGDVQLFLASDEAVLQDFGPLADDKTPRTHEASVRALTNYVLSKIGATLQTGTEDANVTAFWPVTNIITNPRLKNNADAWQTGTGASAGVRQVMGSPLPPVGNTAYKWTAAAGTSNVVPLSSMFRVTPGKWYVFSAYICSDVSTSARAAIQWWSAGGSILSATSYGTAITSVISAFNRITVIAQCPEGAESAVPYVNTTGNAAGRVHYASCATFAEDHELTPYFDGETANTSTYVYEWQAAAHGSTSTRKPVIDRPRELFTWRAGVGGVDFLSPILQANGFRLVCDEERKWTLRRDGHRAPGQLTLSHGVNIIAADEETSRDNADWYDAATYSYTWRTPEGIERTKDDSFALTGTPSKVIRREIRREYPGPGRAEYAVRRVQGRGRTVELEAVADWTAKAEQELVARLDGTPTQLGTTDRIEFELGTDRMRVSARTADTPEGAINLLPGTINGLAGTINGLS